jgi:hypothetical protein
MSIAQISPTIVLANPSHVNPQVKTDNHTNLPQANQSAQQSVQAIKTDTVTISKEALQKLASDGDTAARETRENGAERASEKARGKA